jgi:exopolyphosphatase / guanosine-5'-triphosphate,3'-diphosphate pyrophosphatase
MTAPIPPSSRTTAAHSPKVPASRRAVIDVGTNSVKLLVGEVEGACVRPLYETSQQTRLGQGFYPNHILQPQAIACTVQVIGELAQAARSRGADPVFLVATSAVRDAVNQEELLAAVRRALGLEIRIISGDQEAAWAFDGIATDPRFAGHGLLVLDVGGGSSQCILGHPMAIHFRHSFRMGSVRLFETVKPSDPPTADERRRCDELLSDFLRQRFLPRIASVVQQHPLSQMMLVGTGGTCSILAAIQEGITEFDRDRLEAARLQRAQIEQRCHQLWSMTLEQRRHVPGIPHNRADIILTGAAIYLAMMRELGFEELRVSTRGIRFGALVAIAKQAEQDLSTEPVK